MRNSHEKTMKPKTINVIKGLLIFRLSLSAIFVILFFFIKDIDPSQRSFLSGLRNGIAASLHSEESDSNVLLGYLIGQLIIPVVLALLQIKFVNARKFIPMLVTVILDLLFGLSQGFSLFPIIILIIILTQPTKGYLKNADTTEAQ